KPVILIDPGHGGGDPGAIGRQHTSEKSVVLAVARELQAALAASGRYDARVTRSADVFVALDQRVELSRQAKADLFISLHADAIDD
ncbi:N-acetylmuramoyl-L-alanine amidase, partial [Acinetobacter baumannii]